MSAEAYLGAIRRFEAKVDRSGICAQWIGCRMSGGYGTFTFEGRHIYAHRFAYIAAFGAIPPGLQIDHLCRNRACVRIDHLEAVTPEENGRRASTIEGACGRGHPKTAQHGRMKDRRHEQGPCWVCRTCKNVAQRIRRAAVPRDPPDRSACTRGHPRTPEHGRVSVEPKGYARWVCRTCARILYAVRTSLRPVLD